MSACPLWCCALISVDMRKIDTQCFSDVPQIPLLVLCVIRGERVFQVGACSADSQFEDLRFAQIVENVPGFRWCAQALSSSPAIQLLAMEPLTTLVGSGASSCGREADRGGYTTML